MTGERKRRPPHSTNVLERWVGEHSRAQGIAVKRVQRWIWFMIIIAVLDTIRDEDGEPLFLIKGGVALELRLRLTARATTDVDAAFRESMTEMLRHLDEALQKGYGDFTFERTPPVPVRDTESQRLGIKLSYRGRRWGTVQLEVAAAEGASGTDVEYLDAIEIDQFGLDGPDRIACLGVRYQIAQKLHACTEPAPAGEENERFHDLIDLLLLRDLIDPAGGLRAVRMACVDTFAVREKHDWPPAVIVYPSWPEAFAALAAVQEFPIVDAEEAARIVQEVIDEIDAAD